jgi:hypothetical protein
MDQRVGDQQHLAGLQGVAQLRVDRQVDRELGQRRVVGGGDHVAVVGGGQDDRGAVVLHDDRGLEEDLAQGLGDRTAGGGQPLDLHQGLLAPAGHDGALAVEGGAELGPAAEQEDPLDDRGRDHVVGAGGHGGGVFGQRLARDHGDDRDRGQPEDLPGGGAHRDHVAGHDDQIGGRGRAGGDLVQVIAGGDVLEPAGPEHAHEPRAGVCCAAGDEDPCWFGEHDPGSISCGPCGSARLSSGSARSRRCRRRGRWRRCRRRRRPPRTGPPAQRPRR